MLLKHFKNEFKLLGFPVFQVFQGFQGFRKTDTDTDTIFFILNGFYIIILYFFIKDFNKIFFKNQIHLFKILNKILNKKIIRIFKYKGKNKKILLVRRILIMLILTLKAFLISFIISLLKEPFFLIYMKNMKIIKYLFITYEINNSITKIW